MRHAPSLALVLCLLAGVVVPAMSQRGDGVTPGPALDQYRSAFELLKRGEWQDAEQALQRPMSGVLIENRRQ